MTMRDKIAAVIATSDMHNDSFRDIADAIVAALPGMVPDLHGMTVLMYQTHQTERGEEMTPQRKKSNAWSAAGMFSPYSPGGFLSCV